MASLYLRDHLEVMSVSVGDVAGIHLANLLTCPPTPPTAFTLTGWVGDASHAIIHVNDDELKDLNEKWVSGGALASPDSLIILRVSIGGRTALAVDAHGKWQGDPRVAYVLNARNQQQVLQGNEETARDVLTAFLSMTGREAAAVFSEDLHGCPPVLRPLFERSPLNSEIFPALSVLCQGYLAVHAGPNGKPEVEDEDKSIEKALLAMGWAKVFESDETTRGLDARLKALDVSGRIAMRREVALPSFWNVFDVSGNEVAKLRAAVLASARKEWGAAANESELKPVTDLIGLLGESIADPALVARAYLALAKKMEARGGA